jgi:prophage regulatory protein
MTSNSEISTPCIERLPAVLARIGMGRSWLYQQLKVGAFPRPAKLGARAIGWLTADVDAWIASRNAAAQD